MPDEMRQHTLQVNRQRTHGGRVAHLIERGAPYRQGRSISLCGFDTWMTAHTDRLTPTCQSCRDEYESRSGRRYEYCEMCG